MAWFLKSASTPEEDLAGCQILPPRWRSSPRTKGSGNQRKPCERRRSSKPLEISPSMVNDEVTSGTALMGPTVRLQVISVVFSCVFFWLLEKCFWDEGRGKSRFNSLDSP